jgi:WD40 repeat protein
MFRLWDAATGRLRHRVMTEGGFRSALAFNPDGKALVFSGEGLFRSIDAATGKELRRLELPKAKEALLARFAPDGGTLALVMGDRAVRLFDLITGDEKNRFKAKDGNLSIWRLALTGRCSP